MVTATAHPPQHLTGVSYPEGLNMFSNTTIRYSVHQPFRQAPGTGFREERGKKGADRTADLSLGTEES